MVNILGFDLRTGSTTGGMVSMRGGEDETEVNRDGSSTLPGWFGADPVPTSKDEPSPTPIPIHTGTSLQGNESLTRVFGAEDDTEAYEAPTPPDTLDTSDLILPLTPNQMVASGRYELLERLGKGGFGEVWKARDVVLDAPVAIKVLYSKLSASGDFLARFHREAKIMFRLRSVHAVQLYIYDPGPTPYIVMEFLNGKTLREVLRDPAARTHGLPIDLVGRLLAQLCEVLEKARELGLVHRDLKPENLILLDGQTPGQEHLKVLDFGIAKIFSGDTNPHANSVGSTLVTSAGSLPLCTPAYASPEQASAEPTDHRSDLYTVGVILYEMLTGRLPFESSGSPMMDLVKRMKARASAPSLANPNVKIPHAIDVVILKCLALNPDERFQTPTELLDAFYDAACGVVSPESLVSSLGPASPAARRPKPRQTEIVEGPKPVPRSVLVGGFLGVLALVAFGWTILRPRVDPAKTPEKTQPAMEKVGPRASETVERLNLAGYAPVAGTETEGSGWPAAIADRDSQRTFTQAGAGIYLPEGYASVGTKLAPDGWPERIARVGPGGETLPPDQAAEFLRIPAATFTMGQTELEAGAHRAWSPAHEVTLSEGFYLQKTEVSNGEVNAAYPKNPPSAWFDHVQAQVEFFAEQGPNARAHVMRLPAVMLSWKEMRAYARLRGGRLPSEAQWEYAARWSDDPQKPQTLCVWGDDPFDDEKPQANLHRDTLAPVDLADFPRDTTAIGVIGLAGNARERCRDAALSYTSGSRKDPVIDEDGPFPHAIRGASFQSMDGGEERITFRRIPSTDDADDDPSAQVGFRLVIVGVAFPAP